MALFCRGQRAIRSLFDEAAPDKFRNNEIISNRRVQSFDAVNHCHLPLPSSSIAHRIKGDNPQPLGDYLTKQSRAFLPRDNQGELTGVGNSWLASALAHKACRDDRAVLCQRVPRLFDT